MRINRKKLEDYAKSVWKRYISGKQTEGNITYEDFERNIGNESSEDLIMFIESWCRDRDEDWLSHVRSDTEEENDNYNTSDVIHDILMSWF